MPQTRGRLFDDISRLMTDAAGLAEGARREVETIVRSQLERLMSGMDVVSREEFEAVREMAVRARAENEKLEARIAALEARLAKDEAGKSLISPTLLIRLRDSVDDGERAVYAGRELSTLGCSIGRADM